MKQAHTLTRTILGLAAISFGVAILVAVLAMRGALMRVGIVGGFDLVSILTLSGFVVPPILVGLHTLILRQRCDPILNDKTHRTIAGVQFVSIMAHFYAAFVGGQGLSLGFVVALSVIGGACLFVVRKSPGGLDLVDLSKAQTARL